MNSPSLPLSLQGIVKRYKGNGRLLGYPTANIHTTTTLPDGVYFGFADLETYIHHPTLIFVGVPTTVGDTTRRVEAYLLDIPDIDYYDRKLRLEVRYFHRPTHTFSSIDKLLVIMQADEAAARQWFAKVT